MYLSKLIKCYTSNGVITMQCLQWGQSVSSCVCECEYVCNLNLEGIVTRGGDVDPRGILWLIVGSYVE